MRKPSDLGFDDGPFILPALEVAETIVKNHSAFRGFLFPMEALTIVEQKEERRLTMKPRCEEVARMVAHKEPAVVWCHLNQEADLLEKIIPGARQVSGGMEDGEKEEILRAFSEGELRCLITKPRIGAFGLNWQHCAHMTFFPSHSFEQYYQGVRRCLRFGQKRPVRVDIVTTEGEMGVMKNLQRKAGQADKMFDMLVSEMNEALRLERTNNRTNKVEVPQWL
jgi:ERCC4-related helicase